MMAIFIVEFAAAAGAPLPEMPDTYEMMLRDFKAQAVEWEQTHEAHDHYSAHDHPILQLPGGSLEHDPEVVVGLADKNRHQGGCDLAQSLRRVAHVQDDAEW